MKTKDYIIEGAVTVAVLIIGFMIARKICDGLKSFGVPITTGDTGAVPIGSCVVNGQVVPC